MPGLRLPLPQAVRLFNIDPPQCERILDALVECGELRTNGHHFTRA